MFNRNSVKSRKISATPVNIFYSCHFTIALSGITSEVFLGVSTISVTTPQNFIFDFI